MTVNSPRRDAVAVRPKPSTHQPPATHQQPSARDDLSVVTDALNAALSRAEVALRRFSVEAAVTIQEPDGRSGQLAYRKVGKGWGLFQVLPSEDRLDSDDFVPLMSAPRRFRIAAAEQLAALVRELEASQRAELVRARAAVDAVGRVLAELGAPAGELDDDDIPF